MGHITTIRDTTSLLNDIARAISVVGNEHNVDAARCKEGLARSKSDVVGTECLIQSIAQNCTS